MNNESKESTKIEEGQTETLINNTKEGSKPQKRSRNNKTKMTIFKNLGRYGYTKDEILTIINSLNDNDKEIINLIDGPDLENPVKSKNATKKNITQYYTAIIPKILRRLKSTYGIRKNEFSNQELEQKTLSTPKDNINIQEQTESPTLDNYASSDKENKTQHTGQMTKEDYIKILESLKTPTFYELMTNFPVKNAIIIALRLGYIDNKYYSTESIASFLDIEASEVREITTEILKLHKDNLNAMIDKIAIYLKEDNHTLSLEKNK